MPDEEPIRVWNMLFLNKVIHEKHIKKIKVHSAVLQIARKQKSLNSLKQEVEPGPFPNLNQSV